MANKAVQVERKSTKDAPALAGASPGYPVIQQ
jgi:hypothetical protein